MAPNFYLFMVLFFCFVGNFSFSQNLIPNAGFEFYSECPDSPNMKKQIHKAFGWNAANRATPDFFHDCDGTVPKNYMGHQKSYDGNGYAGILVDGFWKEYLIAMLKEPLVKDTEYDVSMYVSLSKTSELAISELGFCFTVESKYYEDEKTITEVVPQVVSDPAIFLDKKDWTLVKGRFKATGGERFVIIGNFQSLQNTKKIPIKPSLFGNTPTPYYYIDNVSTIPVPIKPAKPKPVIDTIKLNNICFEFDKANLLPASNKELDKLIKLLKGNNKIKIEVVGHTDGDGTYDYNMSLSGKRAKAVTEYIVKSGIKPERVSYKGYGDTRPLMNNETAEDKKLNRRVEVRIMR